MDKEEREKYLKFLRMLRDDEMSDFSDLNEADDEDFVLSTEENSGSEDNIYKSPKSAARKKSKFFANQSGKISHLIKKDQISTILEQIKSVCKTFNSKIAHSVIVANLIRLQKYFDRQKQRD
ncbi:hypothetical protein MHBO_001595 [Bonamia ostreae]|uniref:Uncharacterized protein n=1 Tax=Bonamia ostreae TaxID=126728 RepID=A0ABV2AKD5_9EUKA